MLIASHHILHSILGIDCRNFKITNLIIIKSKVQRIYRFAHHGKFVSNYKEKISFLLSLSLKDKKQVFESMTSRKHEKEIQNVPTLSRIKLQGRSINFRGRERDYQANNLINPKRMFNQILRPRIRILPLSSIFSFHALVRVKNEVAGS